MSIRGLLSLGLVAAGVAAARPASAAVVYGLTNGGTTLVQFDTATPGTVVTVGALGTTLNGLDFRVANGVLYGFNAATGEIFTVDRTTGAASMFSTVAGATNVSTGIDFNPVPNALRIVNIADQNFRITGAGLNTTNPDGALNYAAGDVSFGISPNVNEAAYTNSILPSPRSAAVLGTTLYYIDFNTDSLVTTSAPNNGVLNTVGNTAGNLGVDTSDVTGFDILTTAPNVNIAYATLTVGGVTSLYTINLTTGAATLVGATTPGVFGIAVTPLSVPEPTSLALVGLGVAGAGLARRLRRKAA